jgi:hypothetical protein
MDTALPSPEDICEENQAVLVGEPTYLAQPRSVVLLFSTINQAGFRASFSGPSKRE